MGPDEYDLGYQEGTEDTLHEILSQLGLPLPLVDIDVETVVTILQDLIGERQ